MRSKFIFNLSMAVALLFSKSCIKEKHASCDKDRNLLNIEIFDENISEMFHTKVESVKENSIHNCAMILFDLKTGEKVASGYFDETMDFGNGSFTWSKSGNNNTGDRLSVRSDKIAVFAIANFGESIQKIYSTPDAEYFLNDVNTVDELKEVLYTNNYPSLMNRDESLLMTAYKEYHLTPSLTTRTLELGLKRVDAKISFSIVGEERNGNEFKFIPSSWRICNIPKKGYVASSIYDDEDKLGESKDNYETETAWHNFEDKSSDNIHSQNSFVAYIPQNRLKPQRLITAQQYNSVSGRNISEQEFDSNPKYAYFMRAHRSKSDNGDNTVTNGDFYFAPINASYIEVSGTLEYKIGNGDITRMANVNYTIPLGYVNGNKDDYFVEGNTHYLVKSKVAGVDNIKVEVETNNISPVNHYEFDCGAEGSVFDKIKETEVDAHYGTMILRLKKSDIEASESRISFLVDTPYDRDGKSDYKWLRFVLLSGRNAAKLPGNIEFTFYNGDLVEESDGVPLDGFMYATGLVNLLNKMRKADQDWWIGHNELLNENDEVSFAVQINEFYYETMPTDAGGRYLVKGYTPELFARVGWRTFVNKPNRLFKLYLNDEPLYSADRMSSYSIPYFILSQRSIKTVSPLYNINMNSTYEGFETIDEYENSTHSKPDYQTQVNPNPYCTVIADDSKKDKNWALSTLYKKNESYGYRATLAWAGLLSNTNHLGGVETSTDWADYRAISGGHFVAKRNAALNCLARNSDLNGDGKITMDEIRWYIPAYRQIMRIAIAEKSLEPEYRLLNSDFARANPYYYVSTTDGDASKGTGRHHVVVWANEKYSRGFTSDPAVGEVSIRCVRNLGLVPGKGGTHTDLYNYEWGAAEEPIKVRLLTDTRPKYMETYYNSTEIYKPEDYYDTNYSSFEWADPQYPYDTFTTDANTYNNIGFVIDLRKIDPRFLRTNYLPSGEIPPMTIGGKKYYPTTNSPYEMPYYKGFRVATNNLGYGDHYHMTHWASYEMWYNHIGSYYRGPYTHTSELTYAVNGYQYVNCGNYSEKNADGSITRGWRMPTTTELALMVNYIPWGMAGVTDGNKRGWSQAGWEQYSNNLGKLGYSSGKTSWMAPVVSVTLPEDQTVEYKTNPNPDTNVPLEPDKVYIYLDSGQNGFLYMRQAPPSGSYYHTFQIRCVKDWDPDRGDANIYRRNDNAPAYLY